MSLILCSSLEEAKRQIHHHNLPIRHQKKHKDWTLGTLVVVLEGQEQELVHNELDQVPVQALDIVVVLEQGMVEELALAHVELDLEQVLERDKAEEQEQDMVVELVVEPEHKLVDRQHDRLELGMVRDMVGEQGQVHAVFVYFEQEQVPALDMVAEQVCIHEQAQVRDMALVEVLEQEMGKEPDEVRVPEQDMEQVVE